MPIIPFPLALIQLWIANSALPWSNPVWQSVTHVLGEPWVYDRGEDVTVAATYYDAQAVEAFINNCKMAEEPAEYYAVKRQDNNHEGHCLWNTWVKNSWAKWNINKLVNEIFKDSGCAPHNFMARLNYKITDDVKQIVSIKLADVLFGDDAFTNGSFLALPIVMFVSTVLVSTWSRYRKAIKRQANSINKKTQKVEEQWLSAGTNLRAVIMAANAKPTMASIRTYMKKLETLVTLLSVFKDQDTAKNLDARHEQVNVMLAAAKKDPAKAESIGRLPKPLWDVLDKLATKQEVKELELLIETTLTAMVPLDGDEVVIDFTEDMDRRSDSDAAIDPWSEGGQRWLDDPTSPAQILSPWWHQLVGILRLIDRFLDGKPVMLMDGVGVGKTMQAVGLIACLAHYKEHYRKHKKFPEKFSQMHAMIVTLQHNIATRGQHHWMSEIQRYLRRAMFDVLPYTGKYTARSQWWTMAWSKCQQPPIRHIILVTTNGAHDDAATVFIKGNMDRPLDYGSAARLPQFKDIVQLKNMNQELAATQRRDHKVQREVGVEGSMLRGILVGTHNPEAAQEEYLPAMKQWIGRMREWFSPAVILCTIDSTDNSGNRILGLPSYHDHSLKVKLLDWEMENLRSIARGYIHDCPIIGMSKNFYVDFRRSILHPHMNPTDERSWTKPKSLEEWNDSPTKSTKLDVLAKLLKYHLESDGHQPLAMDESGCSLIPNLAFKAGNTHPDEPDRIVVFSAFVTSNQAIVDILDLHSIHALELNGQTPMKKCKDILDDFRSSAATKEDTLWLEQDDLQLCGRIYRHPQAKEGTMHEAFVGADKEFWSESDDDEDIEHEPVGRNKAGKEKTCTKATAKNPLSPARQATKCKVKGIKTKSMTVNVDGEFGGDSHKHCKDEQPLANIMIKELPSTMSTSGNDDSSLSNPPLTSPSASPSFLLCPSLPHHPSLSTDPLAPAPAPATALVFTPDAQSDQPTGLQDACQDKVAGLGLAGHGHEMSWNDSQDWNDGDDHESRLTVEHDKQPSPILDSFDDIFNKKRALFPYMTNGSPTLVLAVRHGGTAALVLKDPSQLRLVPHAHDRRPSTLLH
ncbi:uncharacterized protein EDB93DRAFT_1103448 [Suillus bovinus]|uniref:uncharacterized protein n=1 Tax=Suillus bovinus TaxID=48563 RepID=UPI001B885964|nr:uncharacterized protein EDB93DRAFT_1103448 [Suillus bovinus]KAG2150754.1 hypothetical protein EDB93DRAFT_1103448 [Suillus bovinus]